MRRHARQIRQEVNDKGPEEEHVDAKTPGMTECGDRKEVSTSENHAMPRRIGIEVQGGRA